MYNDDQLTKPLSIKCVMEHGGHPNVLALNPDGVTLNLSSALVSHYSTLAAKRVNQEKTKSEGA